MHVVIIGAYGSAGVSVADRLVDHVGEEITRLTLVDNGEPGGGLCILRGCMPSKEIISAAAHRYQARSDDRLDGSAPEMDLTSIVATKDQHINNFARHRRNHVHELTEHDGVELVRGTARFVDAETVELYEGRTVTGESPDQIQTDDEPSRTIDADYTAVCTGSRLNVPDIDGIDDVSYLDSADVLDATELPDSGIVMGFGYVGMEMAPYLAEAGVDLTVIEHDDRPLDHAPQEFGDEAMAIYREEFDIDILTGTREKRLEPTEDGGVRLYCESQAGSERAVEADQLFLFTGRRPSVDRLGLENAGISADPGFVEDTMQAADAETVFFAGDVNGKEPLLHIAKEQGQLTGQNILNDARGEGLQAYEFTPHHVMFAGAGVYPYARVGHTAETAREEFDDPIVTRRRAEDDGVFKTKDAPLGLAEMVVAPDGTVVGYQGLHYHADVMAKTLQLAVEMELDVREIPDRAFHPTTPEILDGLMREAKAELPE
ncbi:NAD(P)/FAD-dependent oxidoreductase [Halolamina sp.]|jgi:dihydrolipoamide dehydrogenase|uniref:dihydrolipoyl dehydrogenase family protein n=1 Tax=Halolamina sp. TaxID=1940283 RepID=UPI000223B4F6|nr:Dihydrolipoyl dehydrogenase [halophilic archaeon DL31]